MKFNVGLIINKLSKLFSPAALRECQIDRTARIGSGSYCIKTAIDRYSYIGDNTIVVNAKIGSFCSIASYCCIGGGAHPTNLLSTSPVFYRGRNCFRRNFSNIPFEAEKPVTIGNDVWIGEKVFVKDGITIGNGAIIGALSIVTHDVPSYAIVGGVPAKVIRYRFDSETIETLENIKWWKMEDEKLKSFAFLLESESINDRSLIEAFRKVNA